MIITHQQLNKTCKEYNSLFSKNEFYPIQKAYTTPHFLVLTVRFPGRTVVLYLGRGNQYQGVYLSDKLPPSYLRIQDRFLDYLRKFLVGARLGKMEIDDKNMVYFFHFKNIHTENIFVFGHKDRQLFFIKKDQSEIYLSWSGETIEANDFLNLVNNFEPDKISLVLDRPEFSIDQYLQNEEKKIKGQPLQRKKEKFLLRKINNIEIDLEKVKKWHLLQDDLLNERLNLEVDELNIYDQKIKLLGLQTSWQKREAVFVKIKKNKKAEIILKARLEESLVELENVKKGDFDYELTKEVVIKPLWHTHQKETLAAIKSDYNIKSFVIKNIPGVVGLDAESNDLIRSMAFKEHYWFHIENYKGAHCIIKTDNFSLFSLLELEAIGSMLRDFSHLEILDIPVLYTQLKNIKGIKGQKGQVIVKKAKHIKCKYQNWKEIISIL